MRDRWYRKGGSAPDPQVGAAAQANAAVAERAQAWNEQFYEKYIAPSIMQAMKESEVNLGRQGEIFDLQMSQARLADERYRTLGIAAEDALAAELDKYSAPEYAEKQARSALGDVRQAVAGQEAQEERRQRSLGIDPTSGAARQPAAARGLMTAGIEAAAQTRARDAADAMGLQMKTAKNELFKTGLANTLAATGAASGASSAGLAGATGVAQVAPGGAAPMNTGFSTASRAYGQNLDAYTELQKTRMQQPSALGQIGSLVATGIGAYAGFKSDRRLKKAAKRIATLAHGIGLWAFRYIWDLDNAPLRYGYMADEVERVFPDAVRVDPDGFKSVDYSKVYV